MKRSIKYCLRLLAIPLSFFIFSCSSEGLIDSGEEYINFTAHQIPGCNRKIMLEKSVQKDSCFSYTFRDTLKINFCVIGNCCPDSNRFLVDYKIKSDTINVIVNDIAPNLCRCICNYTIQTKITGLTKEKYLFICSYENIEYKEIVKKSL
ncbi:MAG: hypothetical protein FJ214_11685 [Ignavibacteria bacterium]|nr:hypothetical protein [Ignavibacteria bacterium]